MRSFAVNKQVQRHDTTSNNNNRSLCTDVNINYFGLLARGSATPGMLTVVVVPRGKLKSERGIIFFFPLLKDAGSSRGSRRDISKQTGNRLEGRIYFPAQTGVDTRQPDSLMIVKQCCGSLSFWCGSGSRSWKIVTDPYPDQTLVRIRIQAKKDYNLIRKTLVVHAL